MRQSSVSENILYFQWGSDMPATTGPRQISEPKRNRERQTSTALVDMLVELVQNFAASQSQV